MLYLKSTYYYTHFPIKKSTYQSEDQMVIPWFFNTDSAASECLAYSHTMV